MGQNIDRTEERSEAVPLCSEFIKASSHGKRVLKSGSGLPESEMPE